MRNLVLQKQTRNGQIDVQLLLLTVGMINTRGIILRTVLDIQCTLYYIKLHY